MLRYEGPGSSAIPVSVTSCRRPSSRARSNRAGEHGVLHSPATVLGLRGGDADPADFAQHVQHSAPDRLVPVVGDEAVPVGVAEDAREPVGLRRRDAPRAAQVRRDVVPRACIAHVEIRVRRIWLDAACELLPCAGGDVSSRRQLVVQIRLRVERDPVRPVVEDVFELLQVVEVVQPRDSVQLLDRQPVDADRDRATRLAQHAARLRHVEQAAQRLDLDSLACLHVPMVRCRRP